MNVRRVYTVLLCLQAAAFIIVILRYSQSGARICSPVWSFSDKYEKRDGKANRRGDVNNNISIAFTSIKITSPHRGRLSNCTLVDIERRAGVVLLTTTNTAFLDIVLNMLASIRRIGLCVNTTIIAEDQQVYEHLIRKAGGDPAMHVVMTDSGAVGSLAISREDRSSYYAFMNKRQEYILTLLEKGFEVLFSDSDTFWFRDPFSFFQGDFDMSMVDVFSPYPTRTARAHYCAGFMYLKPSNATLRFIRGWIHQMEENKQRGRVVSDQNVLNGLLHADKPLHVNIKPLDSNIFPYGPKFYSLLKKKANYSTVVMHAASIRGHEAKVQKFLSSNMWLVNATTEEQGDKLEEKQIQI